MCTDGTKIGSTISGSQSYGDYSKMGEELGVELKFNTKGDSVSLTFYRNGKTLGTCFESIPVTPGQKIYPCISLFNNESTQC